MWHASKKQLAIITGVGLALLIPSAAFAATQVESTICEPLAETTITAPTSNLQTESSSVQVVGNATPGKVVTVYKNGVGSGAATTTSSGTYALTTPLETGSNTLIAKTSNECSTTKQSLAVSVQRTSVAEPVSSEPTATPDTSPAAVVTAKPVVTDLTHQAVTATNSAAATPTTVPTAVTQMTLVISDNEVDTAVTQIQKEVVTQPRPNEMLKNSRMWVKGKALHDSIVAIYVNKTIAAQVIAAADGKYGALVDLQNGDNTVHVKATAQDGTVTTRVINVRLVKATTSAAPAATTGIDAVATAITASIAVGGAIIVAFVASHTAKIRRQARARK